MISGSVRLILFKCHHGTLNTSLIMSTLTKMSGSPNRLGLSFPRSFATAPLSYISGTSDIGLQGGTIGNYFDAAVERDPDREAFVFCRTNTRRSLGQFRDEVNSLASGLLKLGLEPGDRLAIWGPNSHEWITTEFAAAKAGIILVNINPAYRVAELEFALNKVQVKALISAPTFKTSNYYSLLQDIFPEMNSGETKSFKRVPSLQTIVMMGDDEYKGTRKFKDVLAFGVKNDPELESIGKRLQMDDIVNIQFTSGTTGNPKAAALSHHNLINNAYFSGFRCEFHKMAARYCVPTPFYHCSGYCANLQIFLHNVTCVFPAPSFESEPTLQALDSEKCTSMIAITTMFFDMVNHPNFAKYDLSRLKTGIIGGSPVPPELMSRIISDIGMDRVTICYGTTENSPFTFQCLPSDAVDRKVHSVGVPLPHTEVKVVSADKGEIVPVGQVGEVCVRGYCVMQGYYNDEEKTKEVIGQDRWYHTGDLGYLDSDGYGHISGRIKDMVIRGGENIYPAEVENFLLKHASIAEAQVIGVPDPRFGEELCAVLKTQADATLTDKEVREFCSGKISHFKIPKYIIFFKEEYPMTATRKVQKFKLREQAVKLLGLQE